MRTQCIINITGGLKPPFKIEIMKQNPTTKQTKELAENLSIFIFGEITKNCKNFIELGEQSTKNWIKRMEKVFNVIA